MSKEFIFETESAQELQQIIIKGCAPSTEKLLAFVVVDDIFSNTCNSSKNRKILRGCLICNRITQHRAISTCQSIHACLVSCKCWLWIVSNWNHHNLKINKSISITSLVRPRGEDNIMQGEKDLVTSFKQFYSPG